MGVGAGLYMCDVVKKVHVRYLISWWVLVFWCPDKYYYSRDQSTIPNDGFQIKTVISKAILMVSSYAVWESALANLFLSTRVNFTDDYESIRILAGQPTNYDVQK